MIVLGIDPGIGRVGWGVVEQNGNTSVYKTCGCIETPKNLPSHERIRIISAALRTIIQQETPKRAVVEKLFFAKNKKTALMVSESRGAIMLTLSEAHISIEEYTPLEVKIGITGNGRAEKRQVAWVVKNVLRIKDTITSDDALDALALCLMARR